MALGCWGPGLTRGPEIAPGATSASKELRVTAVEGGLGNGVWKWKHCYPAINGLRLLRGYVPPNQSSCISKLAAVKITGLRSVGCAAAPRCLR